MWQVEMERLVRSVFRLLFMSMRNVIDAHAHARVFCNMSGVVVCLVDNR